MEKKLDTVEAFKAELNKQKEMEEKAERTRKFLDETAALRAALADEKLMEETTETLHNFFDGKPVNKDPLISIPMPELIVYCVRNQYFLNSNDLEKYCKNNSIPLNSSYSIEYYRFFAGRSDVLKMNGSYYTAVDEDGYGIYNHERSTRCGEHIWEFEYGNLRSEYQLLKDIGITLENDVYGEIDKRFDYLKEQLKEKSVALKKALKGKQ